MASKNAKGESYGAGRTRNYATVVYPESAPADWLQTVAEAKIPLFVSPLHDRDVNPTGEAKKPHYHVQAMFESVKTREQAHEFFKTFGGVGCEIVNSTRGYARYLCHLDNPEKAQYAIEDVKCYGGADYMHAIGTSADKAKAIKEMIAYIEENDIISFAELLRYSSVNRSDWFDCLINSGAYITKEYIKSRWWELHEMDKGGEPR